MPCLSTSNESDIEQGISIRSHPFGISPVELNELTVPGRESLNRAALVVLGDGGGICDRLLTHPTRGIIGTSGDISSRRRAFGENRFPEPPFDSESCALVVCSLDSEVRISVHVSALLYFKNLSYIGSMQVGRRFSLVALRISS